ncbi:AarF/ABC1/UbiB kinase family protein [Thermoleptolyngbya sichuanensis A183]|uniref:AarF/ABC1/UbiB kinase family protein n=1 Tax=Thermoleptolyngbya sichuanensis A183 TaxID=2737172 RepID=A0A6M8B3S3_9CYAN|nr:MULTISPECIES: AarF/ABC1/UbiB kinase family protein [Thermoleptolyngbya]QKD81038.1 AarF/ABC1/UbiB kinase family protein [Thermoleptolyngbya sichuanensis A183]
MLSQLVQTSSRQGEIAEVVLRHGWDYMRRLLSGGKLDEPKLPTPAVLRNILVDLGPVYVKLGQLLSTRPDLLPPDYIEALSTLQAKVPPVEWAEIEAVIRESVSRPVEDVFLAINPEPVAAGSIAQTHRATLKDGREVALKVQRPGLLPVVEQDIALIRAIASLVAQTEFGKLYDVVTLAEEFSQALRAELRFTQEATYTDQLRSNLGRSRWFDPAQLVVPQIIWEHTTDQLLVMEWLDGKPLLLAEFAPAEDERSEKRAIANLLLRAFFQQVCLDGFFHADPHPGNLFYLSDGRVALLDCGMVGRLDPRTQDILLELILAIVSLDAQRCAQLTLQLAPSEEPINLTRLETDYERLLRQYYSLNLGQINFSLLFYEVLQAARKNKIRVPGNLGLCAKAIANLEGVARTLDPEFNFSEQIRPLMTDLFRRKLVGDAPLPAFLRTLLDVKNLSLQSPRQVELLLDRVTSETLNWNLTVRELDTLRRTVDSSANRLSFSIVVGALIMGAAIITANAPVSRVVWISEALFAAASILGLWLIISILRSGRLR